MVYTFIANKVTLSGFVGDWLYTSEIIDCWIYENRAHLFFVVNSNQMEIFVFASAFDDSKDLKQVQVERLEYPTAPAYSILGRFKSDDAVCSIQFT